MTDIPQDRDQLLVRFCELTDATVDEARHWLSTTNWDLSDAIDWYYMPEEEREARRQMEEEEGMPDQEDDRAELSSARPGGGRTLGGDPAPSTAHASSTRSEPSSASSGQKGAKKRFATLGDLNREQSHSQRGGHGHGHGQGHGHDDEEEEDDEERQDLFAGGEKSGLAVQNPGDPRRQVRDILEKARRNINRSDGDSSAKPVSRFSGTGQTLGGDDAPSQIIPDPNARAARPLAKVTRILHFWQNGFSVEDGPLYRFDDPASAPILALIRSGRAPLDIMGVEADQPVDVTVQQHEEDYVPPKKKYKPFAGGGKRLGSPTPGASGVGSATAPTPPARAPPPSSADSEPAPRVDLDESQPTVSLQIRLGDGTRLVSRFNASHTIGAVYDFVNASSRASTQRPWVLMTTFPNKELADKEVKLGDLPEFKRGGVVVQKWR